MEILADAMPDKAAIPRSTDGMVDIQSLLRLLAEQVVNAIMDEEAETWSGSRYFSERKMAEMHDAAFRMGAAGEHDWAELEKAARKMIESSLELADSVEAA